jgi:hypothetical protein
VIDTDIMRSIAQDIFASRIERIYGAAGNRALRELLRAVNLTHRQVPYEIMRGGVTIIAPLIPDADLIVEPGSADVFPTELSSRFTGSATIQVLQSGKLRLWAGNPTDLTELAGSAVIYRYDRGDYFYLNDALVEVPNPTPFPSVFGIPTFIDLENALAYYSNALARHSTCQILQEVWLDAGRVFLVNRPEVIMRKSLAQFLRSTLRNHELIEVREEQNVDESKPVDIKVTWSLSNRIAIIEIKWMGKSVNRSRTAVSTTYLEPRAREGALQLANYLEENLQRAPLHVTIGYLVVFDARRNGVGSDLSVQLSVADADHYAALEVHYDPEFDKVRADFAHPARIFMAAKNLNAA